nr:MAG TPA: hypothetical protein [Bacteriophage sp.]DAT16702.1 MAG TPA: hypothetical protein [Caudoviricetes sp.]
MKKVIKLLLSLYKKKQNYRKLIIIIMVYVMLNSLDI